MAKKEAEYYRNYRATVKPIKEREAQRDGFKAGVESCVETLRGVGQRSMTGSQAALLLSRAMLGDDLSEIAARRRFLDTLRR